MFSSKMAFYGCYGASLILYLILFWNNMNTSNNDIFGVVIFSFYIIIPVVSFLCAFFLQVFNAPLKWIYPFLFAIFGVVIPVIVQRWGVLNDVWFLCILPPFIGAGLGWLIKFLIK